MSALQVRSIAVWTPRFPSHEAWRARAAVAPSSPGANILGTRARGRASLLTRMLAEVVSAAAEGAQLELGRVRLLVGSAFGEMETTAQLLKMMHEDDGALSPARFQSSVHNAAAGALSIATGNQQLSSCLSAGTATAAALVLEARALLAQAGGEVLIAMAEEQLPAFFANGPSFEPASAALVLSTDPTGAIGSFERLPEAAHSLATQTLGPTPVAPLLDLIDALDREVP